jgi:hypothetical protein
MSKVMEVPRVLRRSLIGWNLKRRQDSEEGKRMGQKDSAI